MISSEHQFEGISDNISRVLDAHRVLDRLHDKLVDTLASPQTR